jgi:hypothetical protein
MSTNLPEPIDIKHSDNEGYTRERFTEELVPELVERYNALLDYIASKEGLTYDGWNGWVKKND